MPSDTLKAIALNCTLNRGKYPSSTDKLLEPMDAFLEETDDKNLEKSYDKTVPTIAMLAANAAHLARLLRSATYPGVS